MSKQEQEDDAGTRWMYKDPRQVSHESSLDDYLLGNKNVNEMFRNQHEDDIDKLRKSALPGAKFLPTAKRAATGAADLSRIKQDPMLAIQAAKLTKLKAELEKQKLIKSVEEKDKKKHKKKKDRKKHREDNDERREKKRKRKDYTSEEEADRKRRKREKREKRKEEERREDEKRSNSRSDYEHRSSDRSRNRDVDDDRRSHRDDYHSRSHHSRHSYDKRDYHRDEDRYRRDHSRSYESRSYNTSSSSISEEERNRKLQEMMSDGHTREEQKLSSLKQREEEKQKEFNMLKEVPRDQHNASFLHKARTDAYMDSGHSVEDRLARNVHRIQRQGGD
jgi:hypothetical protein